MKIELEYLLRTYAHLRIQDPVAQARLAASLEAHGQQVPVLVVPFETRYVLIDGYRRLGAAKQLGWDGLTAVALDLELKDALLLHRQLRQTRESALEDGWYLRELKDAHGISQRDLAVQVGCSPSWISRRLALVRDLPDSVQEAVRSGRLAPDAAMKHLVPLSRGNADHAAAIVAAWKGRIRSGDLRMVCEAWARGTPAQREAIAQQPQLIARIEAGLGEDPGAEEGPEDLGSDPVLRDLRSLAGLSGRARRALDGGPSQAAQASSRLWRCAVTTAWADLCRSLARLEASLVRQGGLLAPGP